MEFSFYFDVLDFSGEIQEQSDKLKDNQPHWPARCQKGFLFS